MLGLMFIAGISSFVLLVALAMWAAKRISLKAGQSEATAQRWKYGVLAVVLLAIFWDWLPTWIAYEYYSRQAGFTVFKTLDQWKAENPGVAETLEAYGSAAYDKRAMSRHLPDGGLRQPLNLRFAYDDRRDRVFLSVQVWTFELIDLKTNEVLARYVDVSSGPRGAPGGANSWKFWTVHGSNGFGHGYNMWSTIRESARTIGEQQ